MPRELGVSHDVRLAHRYEVLGAEIAPDPDLMLIAHCRNGPNSPACIAFSSSLSFTASLRTRKASDVLRSFSSNAGLPRTLDAPPPGLRGD